MGGAASVDSALKKLEADGLAQAFNMIDKNGDGSVCRDEYYAAIDSLGIEGANIIDEIFDEADDDGSGGISQEEFVRFCVGAARKRPLKPTSLSAKEARTLKLGDFLSPSEAQHGFAMAHTILSRNPNACREPMYQRACMTNPGGKASANQPPPGGSPWYPLHYVLARLSANEVQRAAAEPLLLRLLQLNPKAAQLRVLEGVRWQVGVLPLEFGITRGWSVGVVGAVAKAFPAAATTLDPLRKKKKFDPKDWNPPCSKGCRFMRKIALEHAAAMQTQAQPEILRLLPRPSKNPPLAWTDGKKVEEEEEEKARVKAEKLAKKIARSEKLAAAKVAKSEKQRSKLEAKQKKVEEAERRRCSQQLTEQKNDVLVESNLDIASNDRKNNGEESGTAVIADATLGGGQCSAIHNDDLAVAPAINRRESMESVESEKKGALVEGSVHSAGKSWSNPRPSKKRDS